MEDPEGERAPASGQGRHCIHDDSARQFGNGEYGLHVYCVASAVHCFVPRTAISAAAVTHASSIMMHMVLQ